jgi:putative flippase GtrA
MDNLKLFTPMFIRFLFIGGINTIFGYGLYALLVVMKTPYLMALFLATLGGIAFNFFSFSRIVFNSKKNYFLFFKFVITYLFVYGVNALLLWLLVKDFSLDPLAGQLTCIPISVILNWIVLNKWVYRKRKYDK